MAEVSKDRLGPLASPGVGHRNSNTTKIYGASNNGQWKPQSFCVSVGVAHSEYEQHCLCTSMLDLLPALHNKYWHNYMIPQQSTTWSSCNQAAGSCFLPIVEEFRKWGNNSDLVQICGILKNGQWKDQRLLSQCVTFLTMNINNGVCAQVGSLGGFASWILTHPHYFATAHNRITMQSEGWGINWALLCLQYRGFGNERTAPTQQKRHMQYGKMGNQNPKIFFCHRGLFSLGNSVCA